MYLDVQHLLSHFTDEVTAAKTEAVSDTAAKSEVITLWMKDPE